MKRQLGNYLLIFFAVLACQGYAQDTTVKSRHQVAIFTPLYLDSAFDEFSMYRYGKSFPKFINPGLEFYEGALMAIDSLDKEGIPLDIFIYDTRSEKSSVNKVINAPEFDSIDLVIGHVNANEARQLANEAAKTAVPFINATYPNDAGVSNNPNYIILNSTLLTHCTAMYRYIQKNYALKPIVFFRKKGAQEDRLQSYFDDISKNTNSVPLKIRYVTLEDNFTADDIRQQLNGDLTTVCIAGSLDVNFGQTLAQHLSALYIDASTILFGMPTWWDVIDFTRSEYKGVEVIFTTPFYLDPTNPLVNKVLNEFRLKYYSRPTDMVYRGFETLYHFAHLLHQNGKNFGSALTDKKFTLINEFALQPVIDPKTTTLDYFENKKIYFIKKVDGIVKAVF